MKRIHLYDIQSSKDCQDITGKFLNPTAFFNAFTREELTKESFSGTEEHLINYTGKWYIEATRSEYKTTDRSSSPFQIEWFFDGNGGWARPVSVHLILERYTRIIICQSNLHFLQIGILLNLLVI